MATLKTQATTKSVAAFLKTVEPARRADCEAVMAMMKRATGADAVLWGTSIIGFGRRRYKYESGREGDWFVAGLSPRKTNLTLYLMGGSDRRALFLKKLGKHTTGKSCIYLKNLRDVDQDVLRAMIEDAAKTPRG
jgi:hypothetical protein